jgi:hypothetical protein
MLSFYANAHKILAVLAFVCLNVECANPYDDFRGNANTRIACLGAPQATFPVESYNWHRIFNQNLIIASPDGQHIATIFTLRYGTSAGQYGAYFNVPGSERRSWPFDNIARAKEWIILVADNCNVILAKNI